MYQGSRLELSGEDHPPQSQGQCCTCQMVPGGMLKTQPKAVFKLVQCTTWAKNYSTEHLYIFIFMEAYVILLAEHEHSSSTAVNG